MFWAMGRDNIIHLEKSAIAAEIRRELHSPSRNTAAMFVKVICEVQDAAP